jgi:hypothetical protein
MIRYRGLPMVGRAALGDIILVFAISALAMSTAGAPASLVRVAAARTSPAPAVNSERTLAGCGVGGSADIGNLTLTAGAICGGSDDLTAVWSEGAGAQYNFTFMIWAVAELTPAGRIDELAPLVGDSAANVTVNRSAQEVNFTVEQIAPVAPTTGPWNPGTTVGNRGPGAWIPWPNGDDPGNATTGNVSIQTVFHLTTNGTGTGSMSSVGSSNSTRSPAGTYQLKFDLAVFGWPWLNRSDHLGFGFSSISPYGAHYQFNRSTGNLSDVWNQSDQPFVSLLLGLQATAVGPNGTTTAVGVSSDAYLWPNASTPRGEYGPIAYGFDAWVLVNFTSDSGGYQSLIYDPWIVFHSAPRTEPTASSPFPTLLIGASAASAAVALAAIIPYRTIRQRRLGAALSSRMSNTDWAADGNEEPAIWRPR